MDQTSVYRAGRGNPMIQCQLHCLTDFGSPMETEAHQTDDCPILADGTMCRGSNVKDSTSASFQLESLILAQNERWRQA